jgi:hypothetical protein
MLRRTITFAAASLAALALSLAPAAAHQVSVATPSGQTNVQVLHSGNTELPPHTNAFPCNVIPATQGNPAVTILGPGPDAEGSNC